MKISNSLYNKLKFIALVLLPAISTLYYTFATTWSLPNTTNVIGTITAIDTFLGVMLGISTRGYNASDAAYDGKVVITNSTDGSKLYSLELNGDPSSLDNKKSVTFKIDG